MKGLQARGIFCLSCSLEPEAIVVGRLWLRDLNLLGQQVALVASEGGSERFMVQIPEELPEGKNPADNVRLQRVTV